MSSHWFLQFSGRSPPARLGPVSFLARILYSKLRSNARKLVLERSQVPTVACCLGGDCNPEACCLEGDCNPETCCLQGDCNTETCRFDGDCNPEACCLDGDCNPEACCFLGERDPDDRCLITVLSCCTIMDLLRAIVVSVILDMSDVTSYSDIEHIQKFTVAIGWEPE